MAETVRASIRDLEQVARLAETPVRQSLLDAARLLGVGDLSGAQTAYEAALAFMAAQRPAAPGRLAGAGERVASVASAQAVMAAYLAALTVAEIAVTFGNPLLVFPLHGAIVGVAAVHVGLLEQRAGRERRLHPLTPFLLAFLLAALIRIISLTLPLSKIDEPFRYVFAGVPMTLGALLVARSAGFSARDVGLVWRVWWLQVAAVLASVALGVIEFAILRPTPMGGFPWTAAGLVPALAVGISTGFPEELIFRGVMQTATRPLLGRWNWVYVSAVFAVLHIGYKSVLDLAFVFGVGLLYGWIFERSRSIVGVAVGHGLANVILFFVAPNLPGVVALLAPK
jgi:membrane protease YdiL (CAAX protease family)